MSSPEMDLLDTLAAYDLPLAGCFFRDDPDPAEFERNRHSLTMQIMDGYVELLRGNDPRTAAPVPRWEVRFVLAERENWLPPADEPARFWLSITERGLAYFEGRE